MSRRTVALARKIRQRNPTADQLKAIGNGDISSVMQLVPTARSRSRGLKTIARFDLQGELKRYPGRATNRVGTEPMNMAKAAARMKTASKRV